MKKHLRSIGLVFAFLIGGVFYAPLSSLRDFLPHGITLMLSLSFLSIETKKLKPQWQHVWLILGIQAIGLSYWLVAKLAGFPILAESLYYCGAAPIATAAPVIVSLMRGKVEFITTAMILSHIAFALLTPLILPFIITGADLSYWQVLTLVFRQISLILVIPALIALVLRLVYPASKTWPTKAKDFSLLIWIFNLSIIAAVGTQRLVESDYSLNDIWPIAIGALVVCLTGFLGGYYLGPPDLKRECSQGLGQKNNIMTLYLAGQAYASPIAYMGPVFYVFFHNIANAIQIILANRKPQ